MTFVGERFFISNSEVQTFKRCRREWWLAWHRGLGLREGEPLDGPAATGTRVHQALAAYYTPESSTDPIAELALIHEADRARMHHNEHDAERTRYLTITGDEKLWSERERELERQFRLETAMIEGYVDWLAETGADALLEVVAAESYVEFELGNFNGIPLVLIAKLDARVLNRQTGLRSFIDHKTVASLTDPMLGLNQQMLHYQLIDFLSEPDTWHGGGAIYNMLRKVLRTRASKPPYYDRAVIQHNRHELWSYHAILVGAVQDMLTVTAKLNVVGGDKTLIYPTPTRDCVWRCAFFKICRMFDDGSRVDAAIETLYIQRDPLHYYQGSHVDNE